MIKIFGPKNWRRLMVSNPDGSGFTEVEGEPVTTHAASIDEVIRAYEEKYAVSIVPYDGSSEAVPFKQGDEPKYFFYEKSSSNRRLVDIHVFRDGREICPKQDLSFELFDGDIIEIGELVC